MAKRVRVKLDEAGMGRFLAGSAVAGMVRSSGERVAAAAGEGFEADTWISPTRGTSRRQNNAFYPFKIALFPRNTGFHHQKKWISLQNYRL